MDRVKANYLAVGKSSGEVLSVDLDSLCGERWQVEVRKGRSKGSQKVALEGLIGASLRKAAKRYRIAVWAYCVPSCDIGSLRPTDKNDSVFCLQEPLAGRSGMWQSIEFLPSMHKVLIPRAT